MSIISEKVTVIDSVIPKHFYKPVSQDITFQLYITPYTLVAQMPRSGSNSLPDFMKCGKHHKWVTIFGICLPELEVECPNYCNHVPHYLNEKLIEMGAEYLIHCILTSKVISEVTQYDFILQTMTTPLKHFILPDNKEDRNGILGLHCTKNPFKLVNISPLKNFREIGSVASGQTRSNARRSALKSTLKFPKDNQGRHENN